MFKPGLFIQRKSNNSDCCCFDPWNGCERLPSLERLTLPVCSWGFKHIKTRAPYCLGCAYQPHAAQAQLRRLSVHIYSHNNFDGWAKIMTNWLCTLLPSPMTSSAAGWQGPDFPSCPTNYKASWPMPSCQALVCYWFFLRCLSTCCVTHCSVTKIALKKKKKNLSHWPWF